MSGLQNLAAAVGLADRWTDIEGREHAVPPETLSHLLTTLGFPCGSESAAVDSLRRHEAVQAQNAALFMPAVAGKRARLPDDFAPGAAQLAFEDGESQSLRLRPAKDGGLYLPAQRRIGYHHLEQGSRRMTVAVAPSRGMSAMDVTGGRKAWGVAAQLYSLPGEGAFGDVADLAALIERVAADGGDAVAISPIHALFPGDPARFSPYSPSTRLFLNTAYAAPRAILPPDIVGEAGALERADLVDWRQAAPAKEAWLRDVHGRFKAQASEVLRGDLAAFRRDGGAALERHALFEALQVQLNGGWQDWPEALRDPAGDAARRFEREHADAVEFRIFLQWLTARGLDAAQGDARAKGMAIGLIADLAIGMDPGGSHGWSRPDELLMGLSVGAPPDLLNRDGQDWGLTALSPFALAADGYAAFLATLRAALRHAGGARIDHVLGLNRLWLLPQGAGATEGAYLRFPLTDLLRLIALESHRHRAVIVGEDLGTVPDGFRKTLKDTGLLGMNVLWFERDRSGAFLPPRRWSKERLALTTTHDLPTVAGWWRGRDCDWQDRIKACPDEAARKSRAGDRRRLWSALVKADAARGAQPAADAPEAVVDGAVTFIAKSGCDLAILPLEDLFGLAEQPNIPGTVQEHPNWRRRLPELAALDAPGVRRRLDILRAERPK